MYLSEILEKASGCASPHIHEIDDRNHQRHKERERERERAEKNNTEGERERERVVFFFALTHSQPGDEVVEDHFVVLFGEAGEELVVWQQGAKVGIVPREVKAELR